MPKLTSNTLGLRTEPGGIQFLEILPVVEAALGPTAADQLLVGHTATVACEAETLRLARTPERSRPRNELRALVGRGHVVNVREAVLELLAQTGACGHDNVLRRAVTPRVPVTHDGEDDGVVE